MGIPIVSIPMHISNLPWESQLIPFSCTYLIWRQLAELHLDPMLEWKQIHLRQKYCNHIICLVQQLRSRFKLCSIKLWKNRCNRNSSDRWGKLSYFRAVSISSCYGQIGSSETEHSVSPLHGCGIDCQPTSDSCVRRRHSGAILRHFYSLLLTELR